MLRHRLPRTWHQVVAGEIEAWRARRIAQTVLGAPNDVCDHLDATLADVAHKVGPTTLDRLLDEAMLRLHPEEREHDSGIAEMTLRADWKDLHDFDLALAEVAAAIAAAAAEQGRYADSLDVRRARAVGVLADPAAAAALLDGRPAPEPRKRAQLVVHLSQDALEGRDPVVRCETFRRAVLDQLARNWCGRSDTHLTVQPVIDLNDHVPSEAYEVRGRLGERNHLFYTACVFPWCTRPARDCDHDHRVPFDEGGASCDCNIAPLCRRHHRLKTHAGWRYTRLETGVFLWSEPHGQQFLRDETGTLDVTPPDRPVQQGSGCARAGP